MRAPEWAISIAIFGLVPMQLAHGQAVISARSGLVHFFDGAVSVASQPLESHLGKYVIIPEGGDLRTQKGRAEVLLTPGVFVRVGENTAIRIVNSSLSDSQVELMTGSAILDSSDAGAGRLSTLTFKGWKLTQAQKGIYRLDSDPPRVFVREGEVEVSAANGSAVSVSQGMELPLAEVLAPEKASGESRDQLSDWADGRVQSIATDNAIAANIQDPATMPPSDLMPDRFTYFPLLGVPAYSSSLSSVGPSGMGLSGIGGVGVYGASTLYQPGFYSLYLPGYARAPMLFGLRGIGTSGAIGLPHSPFAPSRPLTPISPLPRSPVGHAPVHPAPRGGGGVHIGGHR